MRKMCTYSIPIILHYLMLSIGMTLTTILMGRLDDEIYIEAWGLASMVFMVYGSVYGFSLCLETFVSQAYGAREF